jgi:hypothetical protein
MTTRAYYRYANSRGLACAVFQQSSSSATISGSATDMFALTPDLDGHLPLHGHPNAFDVKYMYSSFTVPMLQGGKIPFFVDLFILIKQRHGAATVVRLLTKDYWIRC